MAHSTKPNFFLKRPIFSAVISIIIVLVGTLAIDSLPIAQYPELTPPTVQVSASYPGASAETIASTVLAPLENAINGVEDMLYMTSTASSGSGSGSISVYFKLGTDPNMALVNVNNKVTLVQNTLPDVVRQQGVTVLKRSPSMLQVIALYSPDRSYDAVYMYNFANIRIMDELKRIKGVGDASLFGNQSYSMRIWLQPDKMAKYNLTPSDIGNAIKDQNAQFAPGRLGEMPSPKSTQLTWQIDAMGRLPSVKDFENIIVRMDSGSAALYLKDVAKVELGGQDYSVDSRYNGEPAVMGAVYLLPGANAIETGNLVAARMKELAETFPAGLAYEIPVDTNRFVMESIKEVVKTLMEAMVLVFIVVYLFLQSWRATLIPCLAVPVSIIGTFAGMYVLGYSINSLTLFGMVLAIGIVVDDAIVVLENVERIMRTEHLPPKEATAKAMSEVTGPVIAIVLVLCAVFIPVSFMGGLAGEMYKQFAITISVSVILSGIVALTLTPALCALLLKPHHADDKPAKPFIWFNNVFAKITHRYVRTVRAVKNNSFISLLLFAAMIGSLFWFFKVVPGGLVPDEDQGYMLGMTILPDGASLHRTNNAMDLVSTTLRKNPAVESVVNISGIDITSMATKSNYGTFFGVLVPWDKRTITPTTLTQEASALTLTDPSPYVMGFTPPPISGMSTTGGFEGYIQNRGSGDAYQLEELANQLVAEASKRPEIASVRNLFSTGSPQLYAEIDRERCKALGLPISEVFSVMGATFGTTYINDFNYMGRTFQVRMQSEAAYRMQPESLNDVYVRNSSGKLIPLSAVVTLERRTGAQVMTRYNVAPAAQVMGNPAPGYSSGQALQAMEETAAAVLPADYSLGWAGSSLQEKLASSDTTLIFILAILMVFLILAAQYESWALPIAVLTAVPFGVFGALLATWMRDLANDIYFQVALITIVGLAAKNAILIVEFAVEAWRAGRSLDVAAMHASRLRFRPIIMTSLAFILGCVPLAISSGAGANSRHAIGTAVIGGMLAATFLATLFVPYFFKIIVTISLKLQGKKDPNAQRPMTEEDEKNYG